MKHAIAFALLASAVPAAAVSVWNGNQRFEDFEGRPLGPATFFIYPDDESFGELSGGSIAVGTPAFPAASPSQVYTGTFISFYAEGAIGVHWAAVSALVSGTAPIRLQAWEFSGTLDAYVQVADLWTAGNDINSFLGFGDDLNRQAVSRVEYSSAAPFAMDDFRIGLPNAPIGIPEPASWAMLIAGFGLTGAAMRRVNARRTSAPTG